MSKDELILLVLRWLEYNSGNPKYVTSGKINRKLRDDLKNFLKNKDKDYLVFIEDFYG